MRFGNGVVASFHHANSENQLLSAALTQLYLPLSDLMAQMGHGPGNETSFFKKCICLT